VVRRCWDREEQSQGGRENIARGHRRRNSWATCTIIDFRHRSTIELGSAYRHIVGHLAWLTPLRTA